MANIIILESEKRVAQQMKRLIQEIDPDHTVKSFESLDAFEKLYFLERPPDEETEEPEEGAEESETSTDEDDEFQLVSTINLIILRADLVEGPLHNWAEESFKKLESMDYYSETSRTRLIVTKYEDPLADKFKTIHPLIDDLIYIPIDRLLFLQKCEIILQMPEAASPSFLFNQSANMDIEMSKKTKLTQLSEVGFTLENPFKLALGTKVHFYITLPSVGPVDFYGTVINCRDFGHSRLPFWSTCRKKTFQEPC